MFCPRTTTAFMSRNSLKAIERTKSVAQHFMSTSAPTQQTPTEAQEEASVKFISNKGLRQYELNRPKKLNALDATMLNLLRPKLEQWNSSDLAGTIVGTGSGRAFCAGGDVAGVVQDAQDPATRGKAEGFFKHEFETDYYLASMQKPYIAVMDGYTMGGGLGLSYPAPFRIATEKTLIAMPESKIGYSPDVGASFYLSRLEGEIGTYLALTGETVSGRTVFEMGIATHYVNSRRVPMLLEYVAALQTSDIARINQVIEEYAEEGEPSDSEFKSIFTGPRREALDFAFRHQRVEDIITSLQEYVTKNEDASVISWAETTLRTLKDRSPTSLKVALRAIRQAKVMTLFEALRMELRISTAYVRGASPDFKTGVTAVLLEKTKEVPIWSPATLEEVTDDIVDRFFKQQSEFLESAPELEFPLDSRKATPRFHNYALPQEADIEAMVKGSHKRSGGTKVTFDELVSKFETLHPGKVGVRQKIAEVAARKCVVVDNNDGNFIWLQWK